MKKKNLGKRQPAKTPKRKRKTKKLNSKTWDQRKKSGTEGAQNKTKNPSCREKVFEKKLVAPLKTVGPTLGSLARAEQERGGKQALQTGRCYPLTKKGDCSEMQKRRFRVGAKLHP